MNNLDRLVAERVMGWKWVQKETGFGVMKALVPPDWEGWEPAEESTPIASDWDRAGGLVRHKFSTDIAAAWEVRAAMKQRGFWLLLIDMNDGTWHAAFKSVEPDGRCIYSSECVAICLAALRAVGVTESEIQEAMR